MPKPHRAKRATTSPRILALLRLVRTQVDESRRLLQPLPMTDPVDSKCAARINTALRLAVVQAHGAVLAFVLRYGFYRPSLEMWLLPGEADLAPAVCPKA